MPPNLKRERIECQECSNSGCFVKHCDPKHLAALNEKKGQTVLNKGEFIFREGDPVFGIYFIQTGKVKVMSSTAQEGVQQIVRLATDGHLLGHRGYGSETYPIGATALGETRVCFLDNDTLLEAFKTNFDFIYAVMMFYSTELRKIEDRTKNFGQMTVHEKVTFALLYFIDTFGLVNGSGKLDVSVSRQEIGDIAGTNADQVSRTISQLKELGLITTEGNSILVNDLNGLKEVVKKYR